MKRRILIGIVIATVFSFGVAVRADKTNFSGVWTLDAAKSEGLPPGLTLSMTVTQKGDRVEVESKSRLGNSPENISNDAFVLDGKETDFTPPVPPGASKKAKRISTWTQDGNGFDASEEAVLKAPGGGEGEVTVKAKRRWRLSADGKTLTIEMDVENPNGTNKSKRVFVKNASTATVSSAKGDLAKGDLAKGNFAVGTKLANFTLPDLQGSPQSFDKLKGEKGAVLVWVSAQCPVVKGYNTRINQIADELKAKGVNLIGINSNATESLEYATSGVKEAGYKFPVLIDKGNVLADKLGANVTPEFYYFDQENVLLYHGALDNDRSGSNVTINYLRDASNSALNKQPIKTSKTNAFGCSIKRA